jgi:hypothetical protein
MKDSHDEAVLAAPQALKLCRMIEASEAGAYTRPHLSST